jgi:hypothetical protein
LQGQLYHQIGSLLPEAGAQPKFAQIYFMEGDQASRRAEIFGTDVDVATFERLQSILERVNPYVRIFKQAREVAAPNISIRIFNDPNMDARRYNSPSVSEVAAVIVDDTETTEGRDLILRTTSGSLQRIRSCNQAYNSLSYPLLFPRGDPGWHIGLVRRDGKKITLMDYTNYFLQIRPQGNGNVLNL